MASSSPSSTMKAWQFSSSQGGLEKTLRLNPHAAVPKPTRDQHLIQVIAAAINPVDHKVAEIPLVTRFVLPKPATPGIDVVGRIVTPASGSPLQPGQIVFGAAGSGSVVGMLTAGGLAEQAICAKGGVALLPEGLDPLWGATVCVAGLTAYQTIVPHVREGSNVFLNGGSGGTGIFGIQIAKAKGCYVTTTCSTANVELCKSLGADEVIDYKRGDVLSALKASGRKYDHVVDNVGGNSSLYWKCHEYTNPGAIYVGVGAEISFGFAFESVAMRLLPGVLGGGQRKLQDFQAVPKTEDLAQIGEWMKSGLVKPIIDSRFKFEDAPKAFQRLKTGRAKGKIVIEVESQES